MYLENDLHTWEWDIEGVNPQILSIDSFKSNTYTHYIIFYR